MEESTKSGNTPTDKSLIFINVANVSINVVKTFNKCLRFYHTYVHILYQQDSCFEDKKSKWRSSRQLDEPKIGKYGEPVDILGISKLKWTGMGEFK